MPTSREIELTLRAKTEGLESFTRAQHAAQQLGQSIQTSSSIFYSNRAASAATAQGLTQVEHTAQATGAALRIQALGATQSSTGLRTTSTAAQTASGHLRSLGSASTALGSSLDTGLGKIKAYATGFLTIGAAIATVKGIFGASFGQERLERAFTAITGSVAKGREEMDALRSTANRLGLDFGTLATGYKGLAAASQGTALEGQKTRDGFLAIVEAGRALGLSSDQVSGALKAVEQAMSKGTLQAEELRGQLSERIPGAFNITARALGVTTAQLNKMLEAGQVMTDDWLPKFGRQLVKEFVDPMKGAGGNVLSVEQQMVRFGSTMKEVMADIGRSDFFSTVAKGLGRITDEVNRLRAARAELAKSGTEKAAETEKELTGGVPLSPAGKEKVAQVVVLDAQIAPLKAALAELEKTIAEMGKQVTAELFLAAERMRARLRDFTTQRARLVEDLKTQLPTLRQPPDLLEGDSERVAERAAGKRDERTVQTTRALAERAAVEKTAAQLEAALRATGESPEAIAEALADFYKKEREKFIKANTEALAAPLPAPLPTPATTPQALTSGARTAPPEQRALFAQAGAKTGTDPLLLEAIGREESNFAPTAKSPAGARGVMQIMPQNYPALGVTDPFDITQSIRAGSEYFAQMLKQFGTETLALAAYNAGPGKVERAGRDLARLPQETQRYVVAVQARRQQYAAAPGTSPGTPTPSPMAPPTPGATARATVEDFASREAGYRRIADTIKGTAAAEDEHAQATRDQAQALADLTVQLRTGTTEEDAFARQTTLAAIAQAAAAEDAEGMAQGLAQLDAQLAKGTVSMTALERATALARAEEGVLAQQNEQLAQGMDVHASAALALAQSHDALATGLEADTAAMKLWQTQAKAMADTSATLRKLDDERLDTISELVDRMKAGLPTMKEFDAGIARLKSLGAEPTTVAVAERSRDVTGENEAQKTGREIEQGVQRVSTVVQGLTTALRDGGNAWVEFASTAVQELAKLLTESKEFRTAMQDIFSAVAAGIANMLKPAEAGGPSTIDTILSLAGKAAGAAAGAAGGGGGDPGYYGQAGGVFRPGEKWNVGEAGKELMVTSKSLRLVGINGAEIIRPTESGVIVPHATTMQIIRRQALHLQPSMLMQAARLDRLSPLRTSTQQMPGIALPAVLRQALPSLGTDAARRGFFTMAETSARHTLPAAGTDAYDTIGTMARRATGGPVVQGSSYLVGEQGAELMLGAQRGKASAGGTPGPTVVHIHVTGVNDPQSFVRSRGQIARAARGIIDDGTRGMGR